MKIENPTVEQLNEMLTKIGWRVAGRYPNARIVNHENKSTDYRVMSDRIETESRGGHYCTAFYFEGCQLELLEAGDAVSISPIENQNCAFALFMNHSLPDKA